MRDRRTQAAAKPIVAWCIDARTLFPGLLVYDSRQGVRVDLSSFDGTHLRLTWMRDAWFEIS